MISSIVKDYTGTTTPDQGGSGSNGNKSSRTGASLSDSLVSYPGPLLWWEVLTLY